MQTFCATNIRIVTRIPRQAQPSQALFSMHRAKQKSCDDKYDSYCQRLTSNRRESAPTIPGRNFPTCASTGTLRASRSDRATSRDRFSWIPDAANRRGEVLVRPHSYTGLVIRFYAQVSSCTVSIAPCGAGCDSHRATSPPPAASGSTGCVTSGRGTESTTAGAREFFSRASPSPSPP